MQNATLTALLLDPFITFEEAVKQAQATPAVTARPQPMSSTASRPPRVSRPLARTALQSVPVVHHLPAAVG